MLTKLVDYEYYSKIYEGSSIPEPSFSRYAIMASSYVNKNTYNRINENNIDNFIKYCTCEIAELLYSQDKKKSKIEEEQIVASETVGSHSKSYVNVANIIEKDLLTEEELTNKIYKICYRYMATSGLMYRGI